MNLMVIFFFLSIYTMGLARQNKRLRTEIAAAFKKMNGDMQTLGKEQERQGKILKALGSKGSSLIPGSKTGP